jgi:malonyl-CoA O-methyltransferase
MSSGDPTARAPGLVRAALRKARANLTGPEPLRFEDPLSGALSWLRKHSLPQQGIAVTSAVGAPAYAEVTGYLIPTLLHWGEHELAGVYARWLLSAQRPDGAWADPSGSAPYTFDTGQILKGLLAMRGRMPEVEGAVRRGCDWILEQVQPDGRVTTPDTSQWDLPGGGRVPEAIHLYALQPLRVAAQIYDEARYDEAVEHALSYYLARPGLTQFNTLSHFHAYIVEALIDLGHPGPAVEAMVAVEALQRRDGSIPAYPQVRWTCSTGIAQYAVIWYKLGQREPAQRAFSFLRTLQNPSGGFFGSYGRGANYFPDREISWAVKYYLDALHEQLRSDFVGDSTAYPPTVDGDDGRFRLLHETVTAAAPKRALDAGCGSGRFARRILEQHPQLELHGLDVSQERLDRLPPEMRPAPGSLLDLPYADGFFDLVYCIETLEHAVNMTAAVGELCRVVRPGGTLLIIDKNRRAGTEHGLRPAQWETWFVDSELQALLEARGFSVEVQRNLPYDDRDGSDELFLGWVARAGHDT